MCCGRSTPAASVPRTTGDYNSLADLPPRFKVVSKTETDPETGKAVVLSTHADYRLADAARKASGGVIRIIEE